MSPRAVKIMRRSLIALALVVLLLVAVNYLQVWYRRARMIKQVAQILSPEMLRSFEGFEYSSTPNGVLRFRIRARRLVDTRQGKSIIEGIEAYDFNPDGSARNSIRSKNATFDKEKNTAEFSGNVHIFLGDKFELQTDSLRYDFDAQKGETTDQLQFVSPIAAGTARGVVFDQGQRTLELISEVRFILNVTDSSAGKASGARQFHASADRAFFNEEMHRFTFLRRAKIDSERETLSADSIEAVISPDMKRVTSLVCVGNAAYKSGMPGSDSRFIRGDRIVIDISRLQSLKKISVAGQAVFSSEAPSEVQTLSGNQLDLIFDGASDIPEKIEGRGGVRFRRNGSGEAVEVVGNTFVASFSGTSKSLQEATVREQASMSINDAAHSMQNNLQAEEIHLSFADEDGRPVIDRLRARGGTRWVFKPGAKKPGDRQEPSRTLQAAQLEILFSKQGNTFQSGRASGNVTVTEKRNSVSGEMQSSRLAADSVLVHFFPGNNQIKDMVADGRVQTTYEKLDNKKEKDLPEKFSTASDHLKVAFVLYRAESAVQSAAQWGNFIYRDTSMTATAGRCEYDAAREILVLLESPQVSDEMSSTSGERIEYLSNEKVVAVYGQVRSRLKMTNSGSFLASSSNTSPAIVTADEMHYWSADRRVRFSGKVQVLSESGQLQAGRLDLFEGGARVEAQDAVRHYIPKTEASKSDRPADKAKEKWNATNEGMTVHCSNLKYGRQSNKVIYSGSVTVRSGELTLSSETMEVEIGENREGIDHATARGNVRIRQKEMEARADVAEYFVDSEKFILTGNPAEIIEPGKVHSSAPQLTYFIADDRIQFGKD